MYIDARMYVTMKMKNAIPGIATPGAANETLP